MHPYLPVLIVIVVAVIVGIAMSAFSHYLGPRNTNRIKKEVFECGVPQVSHRDKMSVKFYLTTILFILFDIETIFLFLWAKTYRQLGWFGFIEILVFMTILLVGYIYVLRRGALEWD